MMIQHVPCKQTLVCHVAVENNLYFSYTTALLYCINTVMTRVAWIIVPIALIHSEHVFAYITEVLRATIG